MCHVINTVVKRQIYVPQSPRSRVRSPEYSPFFSEYRFFNFFFCQASHRLLFHNRGPLGADILFLYCFTSYQVFVYTWHVCMHRVLLLCVLLTAVAASSCCCCIECVPDGKSCRCGPLNLIPVFSLSSFKHDLFLCTPWQYCRIFDLDLPIIIRPR